MRAGVFEVLGRSHALCGLTAGAVAVAFLDYAPLPVRIVLIPVAGGSALLPDIDKPGSRVAKSLGPITGAVSHLVSWIAIYIYHLTRTGKDSPRDNAGHRRIPQTIPGCLLSGALMAPTRWDPVRPPAVS